MSPWYPKSGWIYTHYTQGKGEYWLVNPGIKAHFKDPEERRGLEYNQSPQCLSRAMSHGGQGPSSSKKRKKMKSFSHVRLFASPWTVACQAPPSIGFSRQEYWSGLSFPSPGDLPDPGIEPGSPALHANFLPSEPPGSPVPVNKLLLNYHSIRQAKQRRQCPELRNSAWEPERSENV